MALPLEQRIVEQQAQPSQRMADRRLRQVQFLAGAGHAAFVVNRGKNDKEIEIDTGYMHDIYL